jgi:hypothetical protein
MRRTIFLVTILVGMAATSFGQTDHVSNSGSPLKTENGSVTTSDSTASLWMWLGPIVITAVASPLIVKWVEKRFMSNPVKDQAELLKATIEVTALREAAKVE